MKNDGEKMANEITLAYMTNPQYRTPEMEIDTKKTQTEIDQLKSDKRFYRKRILSITKDLFKKNDLPGYLVDIHTHYITSVIQYLKMKDTEDILQTEFSDIPDLDKNADIPTINSNTINEVNEVLYNIKKPTASLDNYVIHKTKKTEDHVMPKRKKVDLRNPLLKTKGIVQKSQRINKKKK